MTRLPLWLVLLALALTTVRPTCAASAPDKEPRLQDLRQSLSPENARKLSDYDRVVRREQFASLLLELKHHGELRTFAADLEAKDTVAQRRQQWCFLQAEADRAEGRFEPALAAYERVFTAHAGVGDKWPEAQARIVDVLASLGRTNDALRAGRVLWESARDPGATERASQRLAELLQRMDGSSARADALLAMQRHGPAGKDGKPGTPDDPAPIIATIPYPDSAARRRAFDSVSPELGDNTGASILRGYARLHAGDPQGALTQFVDGLRRCRADEFLDTARAVANGFRAVRGHAAGSEEIGQFTAYGTNGPDGKPGTDDDVADPFAAVGLAGASRQPGGLTPLTADDAAQIHLLIGSLRVRASRPGNAEHRLVALEAYRRACQILVVLNRQETLDWVLAAMRRETDGRVLGALARLGQTAAKAGQLDMSGVRRFDADTLQVFDTTARPLPNDVRDAQRRTEHTLRALEKRTR
jgi:hypothetical protein